MVVLGGKIAMDVLFPGINSQPLSTGAKVFYALAGVCLIIAGFINTILLKVLKFWAKLILNNDFGNRPKRNWKKTTKYGCC